MADTHEEQLLSHWLHDIARQDERLRADHLEARLMSSSATAQANTGAAVRPKTDIAYCMKAAALAISVLIPPVLWMRLAPAADTVRRAATTPTVVVPETVKKPPVDAGAHAPVRRRQTSPTQPARVKERATPTNLTTLTNPTQFPDHFVPLMPMTPQELTGPFQIVRVKMPRASLGALRSPLEYPNELVEADVLLGEDGMARAIRVSTGGSVSPWRSR